MDAQLKKLKPLFTHTQAAQSHSNKCLKTYVGTCLKHTFFNARVVINYGKFQSL